MQSMIHWFIEIGIGLEVWIISLQLYAWLHACSIFSNISWLAKVIEQCYDPSFIHYVVPSSSMQAVPNHHTVVHTTFFSTVPTHIISTTHSLITDLTHIDHHHHLDLLHNTMHIHTTNLFSHSDPYLVQYNLYYDSVRGVWAVVLLLVGCPHIDFRL